MASFAILADMVREIGGPLVDVRVLVPSSGDMHGFQPSPGDVRALAACELFVVNGLGLEGWLPRLTGAARFAGRTVVAADGVAPRTATADPGRGAHDHAAAGVDPHAWQDLRNGRIYAENIARGLAAVDAAHAPAYEAGLARYAASIAALDVAIRAELAPIPAARRRVVTSHAAFDYYGAAYGIAFLAPLGLGGEAEPSPRALAALTRQIRQENVAALFLQDRVSPRLIAQLARDTGVAMGPPLYADRLSGPDGPAPTYLRMLRHNTDVLKAALLRE